MILLGLKILRNISLLYTETFPFQDNLVKLLLFKKKRKNDSELPNRSIPKILEKTLFFKKLPNLK